MEWKRIFIGVVWVMFVAAFAQADVVYLKDGSVIKGKVIESVPGVSYKIKTGDGSIFVFEVDKVERIKFEEGSEVEKKVAPVEKKGPAVVYLKNGSVIKGEVIETVPGVSYKIKTADGSIFVFEVDRVERVKFEEVPEAEKRVAPVEEARPVKVKEKPALPSQKMPISAGGGIGIFKVESIDKSGTVFGGRLQFIVSKNFAIQGEVNKGKCSGTEKMERPYPGGSTRIYDWKSTYNYTSLGATLIGYTKLSPQSLLSLYGGGGISRYSWDYTGEGPDWWYGGGGKYYLLTTKGSFKYSDFGYHLLGGAEYKLGENLFFYGELRRIFGTIEKPKLKLETTQMGGGTFEQELKDWAYGHTVFSGGLRLSF